MATETTTKTTYIPSGFLIRDEIAVVFDQYVVDIAERILQDGIAFRSPGLEANQSDLAAVYEVIGEFIDIGEIEATETELDLFVRWLEFHCILREAIRAGYMRELQPGLLRITPEGTNVEMLLDGPLADTKIGDLLDSSEEK